MKKTLFILLLAACLGLGTGASAAKRVYDAKNHDANLATKIQMIQQVENSTKQLENENKQLAKLDSSNSERTAAQLVNIIAEMESIRNETDAIGTDYGTLLAAWAALNPEYDSWSGVSASEYAAQRTKMRSAWSTAALQALASGGMASPKEQYTTQEEMQLLMSAAQNADGQTGVMQACGLLLALMIGEQQKMQVMMADSARSQSLYHAKLIDDERQAARRNEEARGGLSAYDGAKITSTGGALHKFK